MKGKLKKSLKIPVVYQNLADQNADPAVTNAITDNIVLFVQRCRRPFSVDYLLQIIRMR